jgi:hypothetical protein
VADRPAGEAAPKDKPTPFTIDLNAFKDAPRKTPTAAVSSLLPVADVGEELFRNFSFAPQHESDEDETRIIDL